MKKYFVIMMLGLMFCTSVNATWTEANCNDKGGQMVTVGGQTFCKSTTSMNWWSAYAWCQAMGGHMPTVNELCPKLQSITQDASCGTTYNDHIWTATPGSSTVPWIYHNSYKVIRKEPGFNEKGWPRAYCLSN